MKLTLLLTTLLCNLFAPAFCQDTLKSPHVEAILYKGSGENHRLIVGLGGSEGGNAWATYRWKVRRNEFIDKGYAFLAIGYFGCAGTPKILDRIAIEDVYADIKLAEKSSGIKRRDITI